MAVTLTPTEVKALTGVCPSPESVSAAAFIIQLDTRWSVDQHVDDRLIPADTVKLAWAMTAARIYVAARGVGAESLTSETQGDYSIATDTASLESYASDPMKGLPRTLLTTGIGFTYELRPGARLFI